jgi:hypothetical protein
MKRIIIGLPLVLLIGCTADNDGDSAEGDVNDGGEVEPRDERVPIPPEDPDVLSFFGAEVVVESGEERMVCIYTSHKGADVAFNDAYGLQGKGGHHAVLLAAKKPQPDGTVEDCTDAADMSKYDVLTIPQELPDGYGSLLTSGRQMVIQSHYVNTTDEPILIRDIVQLHTMPMEEVVTWAAPFVTNTLDLEIPAGKTAEVSFDCEVPVDVDLLMVGGHMHEWGTKFTLEMGATPETMEMTYLVDPWQPEFRDLPPVTLYFEAPKRLAKGTVVRTTCNFNNTEDHALVFPHEMCTSFGIVGGLKEAVVCGVSD